MSIANWKVIEMIHRIYTAILFTLLIELLLVGIFALLEFSAWIVFGIPMFSNTGIKLFEFISIIAIVLSFIFGLIF